MSDSPDAKSVADALHREMPAVFRWAGAVASRLRRFDVAIDGGKVSGSSNTDALTLADLTVQELLVAALRDTDPLFRTCRLEAEETTGDLARFAAEGPLTIALDPIDGTKQFRDHTGDGWAVMLNLRSRETVHYSLVHIPDAKPHGRWVEVFGADAVRCGEDDPGRPARDVLESLPPLGPPEPGTSRKIYVIGFQDAQDERAAAVTAGGLEGVAADDTVGSVYDLMATGAFAGSLIHSPNIYDYPTALQIARAHGGDSVWTDTGEPVHFDELWLDGRADMLRLPRIVATSFDPDVLKTLCEVARGWSAERYGS